LDIGVGLTGKEPIVDDDNLPLFGCGTTQLFGVPKGLKLNVNPGTTFPSHELWSADFGRKCSGQTQVLIRGTDPAQGPQIIKAFFSNTLTDE
jgi:hypothetical protein